MKIAYFEACDFNEYPVGGTLSFAKQLINSIPTGFKLIGLVNNEDPVGKWFTRNINGIQFEYFGICRIDEVKKSLLPKRLYTYLALRNHIKNILNQASEVAFTQSPQFVFILRKISWKKFYFLFAGLGNSVGLSKYRYLRFLGGLYERELFKHLKSSTNVVFAAADSKSISLIIEKYKLPTRFIISFPTRFNSDIFKVANQTESRTALKIPLEKKVYITIGKLSYIKGWEFIVNSFRMLVLNVPETILIFLGDGEDRDKLCKYCYEELQSGLIMMHGQKNSYEVALYLNAADVFVMGSLTEGWPTAMVEALACGKPIVTTNVSGACEMIDQNKNGYIVYERNPKIFSDFLFKALYLENPNPTSLQKAKKYSTETLGDDFIRILKDEKD